MIKRVSWHPALTCDDARTPRSRCVKAGQVGGLRGSKVRNSRISLAINFSLIGARREGRWSGCRHARSTKYGPNPTTGSGMPPAQGGRRLVHAPGTAGVDRRVNPAERPHRRRNDARCLVCALTLETFGPPTGQNSPRSIDHHARNRPRIGTNGPLLDAMTVHYGHPGRI